MPIADYRNSASRVPVTKVIIKLDTCTNVFGVAPCTATGAQCYNTFYTCKDKPNFARSTKVYKFCSAGASQKILQLINALPLVDDVTILGTEIKDDKTIPARVTVTLNDTLDFDQTTDPYWKERNTKLINAKGTFLKKLIERNQFFKGRVVEVYEGYEGLAEEDYELIFSGKIENITRDGNRAKLECVDEISDLLKKKYPFKTKRELVSNLGACFEAKNVEEMLKLSKAKQGDYALRRDFLFFSVGSTFTNNVESTLNGIYYYQVIGYDIYGRAIAASNEVVFDTSLQESGINQVTLDWSTIAVPNVAFYKVWGRELNSDYKFAAFYQQNDGEFTDYGNVIFTPGIIEEKAYRLFELLSNDASDLNAWENISTAQSITVTALAGLKTKGYIQLQDEVIFYDQTSKDINNNDVLHNILRLEYNTKAEYKHYEGTNLYALLWYAPDNPFAILTDIFDLIGVNYDEQTFTAYEALYSGINFSCYPLIKESDFAKLVYDLCYVLDLELWVNERGQLICRYASDVTIDHTITDNANIIVNTDSVDFNQEEIFTRFLLYWDRKDLTKAQTEKDNYNNLHFEIDADAESEHMYGEEIPDEKTTVWINSDCGTSVEITTYISQVMNKKAKRSRMPRAKFTFEVELKDRAIKTGNRISLTSDAFNEINGNDYSGKVAEVIKKEPKGNRVALTVRLMNTDAVTTTGYNVIKKFDITSPLKSLSLNEIRVTNLTYIDAEGLEFTGNNLDKEVSHIVKLRWDNMYASEEDQAYTIGGLIKKISTVIVYPTMDEVIDLAQWQKTLKYNVYMFVANNGQKYPAVKRPTLDEQNGKWYSVATVADFHSLDAAKKYLLHYTLPLSVIGRYIAFDVYADCNIAFDPNAPVGIEIGALQ